MQRDEQRLGRAGRQVDAADERLAVGALHLDVKGQRPVHRALDTQAHGARLRPVPGTRLRAEHQARLGSRVEGDTAQHLAFGRLFGVVLRQAGVLGRHLDHIGRPDEVEQRLLPLGRRHQRRSEQQGKRAGSVRIIRTKFSQTADDWPDDSDEIDHAVGESAHSGLRNFAPERRQGIEDRLAIALGNQAPIEQSDGAAVFFGTQQPPAGLYQLQ